MPRRKVSRVAAGVGLVVVMVVSRKAERVQCPSLKNKSNNLKSIGMVASDRL